MATSVIRASRPFQSWDRLNTQPFESRAPDWIADVRRQRHFAVESLRLISFAGRLFRALEKPFHGICSSDGFAHVALSGKWAGARH
jgi:hypothetical protein